MGRKKRGGRFDLFDSSDFTRSTVRLLDSSLVSLIFPSSFSVRDSLVTLWNGWNSPSFPPGKHERRRARSIGVGLVRNPLLLAGKVKLDNFSFQHCKLFGTSSVGGGYLRSSLPTHPLSYTRLLRLSCFNLFLSSPSDRPPTKQLSLPSFFSKMSSFFAASFFYSFERLKSASITTLPLFIYYIYASPSYIFEIIELFSML